MGREDPRTRAEELVEVMTATMDRLINLRESTIWLDRAIEIIVGTSRRFNGKDVSSYLEIYKAERLMRDILEARKLATFVRVVVLSIHAKILELQVENRNWEEFERGS